MYTYYAYITHVHPLARSNWFIRICYTVKCYARCMFMLFTHICYKLFESVSHPKKDVNTSKKWSFFHFVCTYSQNVKLCLFWYTHSHSRRGAFCHLAHPKICKFLPRASLYTLLCSVCAHVIIIMHTCHSLSFMCSSKKNKMCALHVIKNIDIFTFTCPYKQNTKFHHFWYTH